MARPRRTIAYAIAILVSCPVILPAQRTITRSVFVSAVDSAGKPVLDLEAEEFGITENNARRPVVRAGLGTAPLRIVLMVDSSSPVSPVVSTVKKGLTAFVETLSPGHDIAFISSGGQIRVRARPGDTRAKLYAEIGRFSSEGGANAFLDTLLEADTRFLKPAPAQWPVFVIVTTDNGDTNREPDVASYNKFMNDFVARGGAAHAIILIGKRSGPVTDLVSNLVDNAGGFRQTVNTEHSLPERLTEIAERLDIGHRAMFNRYEIAYAGDPAALTPIVNVTVSRPDVRLQMSPRRPF
jgi:hypothetical protein